MRTHQPPSHRPDSFRRWRSGFSLLEVVVVIAAVFVISGVALVATLRITEGSMAAKLESDVATINSAVSLYLASGGSLDHVVEPEDVLDSLKTTRSSKEAKAFAGAPSSSMIDRRITAQLQSSEEAAEDALRAVWDRDKQRFVLANTGFNGVKKFLINEEWTERDIPVENRSGSTLAFSAGTENTWIWDDGQWVAERGNLAPTQVQTYPNSTPETTGVDPDGDSTDGSGVVDDSEEDTAGGNPPPEEDPPPPPRLPRPNFDQPPGSYPIYEFPMLIGLTNLPDPAYGEAYYKIYGDNSWTLYTGAPIPVEPGQRLYAQALTLDPDAYRDSYTKNGKYVSIIPSFSGTTEGNWEDPQGGPNLLSEISNSEGTAEFLHGNTQLDLGGEILDAGVQNRINFTPSNIVGVEPNTQFEIGTLTMLNGTTFNSSEASSVNLDVSLDIPELGGVQQFDIPFAMENTENSDDREASADIIELLTLILLRPVVDGVRYDLVLSIGIVDDNGVTDGSKFLIYEGATANGKIYGKFIPRY